MIDSIRAFLPGNSGSGKSYRAWNIYLAPTPRRLIIDNIGEWSSKADSVALTVGESVDAIRYLAKTRGSWTVTLQLDRDDLAELVDWLIPLPDVSKSPILTLGGASMLIDECDLLMPSGQAPEHGRTLYRRSRHVGLSVISTTTRAANVSREVTAQCTHLVALAMQEPADVDFVAKWARWTPELRQRYYHWTTKYPQGALWQQTRTGQRLWLPQSGQGLPDQQAQIDAFDAHALRNPVPGLRLA